MLPPVGCTASLPSQTPASSLDFVFSLRIFPPYHIACRCLLQTKEHESSALNVSVRLLLQQQQLRHPHARLRLSPARLRDEQPEVPPLALSSQWLGALDSPAAAEEVLEHRDGHAEECGRGRRLCTAVAGRDEHSQKRCFQEENSQDRAQG